MPEHNVSGRSRSSASYSGTGGGLLWTPKWLGWYDVHYFLTARERFEAPLQALPGFDVRLS